SSITVDRKLLKGNGFLARGHYRPRVQVGPETHQRVNREVETRDAHISSSIRRVYHHFEGHALQLRLPVDGSALTRWAGYDTHSRSQGMIRLKYKEYNMLGHTSLR
ncbi:hypothetical protein Goshw_013148, partial [Gossypium schwendimanii]|nr:hypothetical protein [Gossypium schwendimanii]